MSKKQPGIAQFFTKKNANTEIDSERPIKKSKIEKDENEIIDEIDCINNAKKLRSDTDIHSLDISDYLIDKNVSDTVKLQFIRNRKTDSNFQFPARDYKDSRTKSGFQKRRCLHDYFVTFTFLIYSMKLDGVFCLACIFFPSSTHQGTRSKLLIEQPFRNWKDAKCDLKNHGATQYHLDSMAKLEAFVSSSDNPGNQIVNKISKQNVEQYQKNRDYLISIVKCLVYCGRQGIALRGHRDDDTSNGNKGNFKQLIELCADLGVEAINEHFRMSKKNATYISKTSQNELLSCILEYIQAQIVKDVAEQSVPSVYGISADEVTDSANWEQLGVVIRYIENGQPVERLLQYIQCESITGENIAKSIIECLNNVGLDPKKCRAQTYDGAGNMAGCQKGCAVEFQKKKLFAENRYANYLHCASHELNLALGKACKVKDIHVVHDIILSLTIFFKYSPKRTRKLEQCVTDYNSDKEIPDRISKSKVGSLSQTRWVERHTCFDTVFEIYEPLLECLELMTTEVGWDMKTVTEANGLLTSLSSSKFICAFCVCREILGYTKPLSVKLQKSSLDVAQAYSEVTNVIGTLQNITENCDANFRTLFGGVISSMAQKCDEPIQIPRRCIKQTVRNNMPADNAESYYKRTVYIPFLDSILSELNARFTGLSKCCAKALLLLPANLEKLDENSVSDMVSYYEIDLPDKYSVQQEIMLWKNLWATEKARNVDLPSTIVDTLKSAHLSQTSYPNIFTIINVAALTSVTSAGVERANSSLRLVKNVYRSTMGEERLNALLLLFVHKDIHIDYAEIVNIFARRHSRKMQLLNPLGD